MQTKLRCLVDDNLRRRCDMQFRCTIIGAALILAGSITTASAKSDTSFLTDAIQINLAEISVGDLAQKNGGSDDVKSFGKMLVDDHTASNTKATSLAQANGVTPPTEPNAADKKNHDELGKLSGEEFDREFAKAMVKGHEEAIAKFEAASKGNDDVAKFAQDTLPTLQKHLKTAQSLASSKSTQSGATQPAPLASEATKPQATQVAPLAPEAAKPEAAQPVPSAPKSAEKMAASESVSVTDYYKQNVYDASDNTIGEVSDVVLDKHGHVTAVILSVGGFLGLGTKYVSIPFNALHMTEKNGKRYLVMDTTKESLTSAPGYQFDKTTGKWVPETK
jgi:putative membrane protein